MLARSSPERLQGRRSVISWPFAARRRRRSRREKDLLKVFYEPESRTVGSLRRTSRAVPIGRSLLASAVDQRLRPVVEEDYDLGRCRSLLYDAFAEARVKDAIAHLVSISHTEVTART